VTELVLRIVFSLLVVLALMWGVARIARRPLSRRGGAVLTVLARQQLSRGSAVAVLRVLDQALVLGITDHQITLLGEADLATVEQQQGVVRRSTVQLTGTSPVPPAGIEDAGVARPGRLAGSVLSPRTWAQVVEFLRDRTVRKP
jgi:flagellar protein FliO/FliZ